MKKIHLWQIILAVVLSNALVLIIHGFLERNQKVVSPDTKFLLEEVKRLDEKIIQADIEIHRLDDGIKKIDTVYFVTEKNYYIRSKDREKIHDTLLENEWKKFGY